MTHHESQHTTTEGKREKDGQASEMRQKARETAENVTHQAKEQTRELADTAKEEARSMAETRKSQVTSELHNIAQAFRTSGRELRTQNEEPVARYANQIADRIENASSYLSGHSVDDLLADAEDFARRQPEIFLGSAFGLGLIVSRFFKSSERQYVRHGDAYSQGAYSQGRGYGSMQRTTRDWETPYAGESSLPAGQSRTTTGQTGTTTGQKTGTTTGQSGTSTRQSGTSTGQSGTTSTGQSTTRKSGGDDS